MCIQHVPQYSVFQKFSKFFLRNTKEIIGCPDGYRYFNMSLHVCFLSRHFKFFLKVLEISFQSSTSFTVTGSRTQSLKTNLHFNRLFLYLFFFKWFFLLVSPHNYRKYTSNFTDLEKRQRGGYLILWFVKHYL